MDQQQVFSYQGNLLWGLSGNSPNSAKQRAGRKGVGGWREGTIVSLVRMENWSDLFDFNNFYQNESPLRRPRQKFECQWLPKK